MVVMVVREGVSIWKPIPTKTLWIVLPTNRSLKLGMVEMGLAKKWLVRREETW